MERRIGINQEAMFMVQDHYSRSYRTEKEDSPNSSRDRLRRRLHLMSEHLDVNDVVLDLGAGRQIFERSYIQAYGQPNFKFVSADFAKIKSDKLLSRRRVGHVRASGSELPIADKSISVVVSSMALDFMPREALGEVARVMKPNARALVTLHHKDLVDEKLAEISRRRRNTKSSENIKNFFEFLKDGNVLFSDEEQIRDAFESSGFETRDVRLQNDRVDKWWEVDLVKKPHVIMEAEDNLKRVQTIRKNSIDWLNA